MPKTRTIGPLTPSLREKKSFTSVWEFATTGSNLSPPVSFRAGDLAQISVYCLLTVLPETCLSQQRSTHIQISDVFSRGHDPIDHARRARCLAHVRYIFIECVIHNLDDDEASMCSEPSEESAFNPRSADCILRFSWLGSCALPSVRPRG